MQLYDPDKVLKLATVVTIQLQGLSVTGLVSTLEETEGETLATIHVDHCKQLPPDTPTSVEVLVEYR